MPAASQLDAVGSPATIYTGSGAGATSLQRRTVGLCEVDLSAFSPSKVAIAVADHLCPAPTPTPGTEPVHASMGLLTLTVLLRKMGLLRDSFLGAFSDQLVRESPLDKEFVDIMAVCSKLEALAGLGYETVTLKQLFPGLFLDPQLAVKEFIVPVGRLSAGGGRRESGKLSKQDIKKLMEATRDDIMASVAADFSAACCKDLLNIGFVGVGNKGEDSMLVLVEAGGAARAWGFVVQTKQDTAARPQYETLRGILAEAGKDLASDFRLPRLLPSWTEWLETGRDDAIPAGQPSNETWDESRWDGRVIYSYVTDSLFSERQEAVRKQLIERRHPWMGRLLIVSRKDSEAWYSRAGALLRGIRLAAMTNKSDLRNRFKQGMLWPWLASHLLEAG